MSKMKEIIARATEDISAEKYGKIGSKFISIRQFADIYGVSYVTASRAFQQLKINGNITQSVKSYSIADCSSVKNSVKKCLLFGVHVRDISNNFYSSLCSALSLIASEYNVQLIFMSSNNDNLEKRAILRRFTQIKCDGIINLNSFKEYELNNFYKLYPLPLVFFGINPLKDICSDFLLTDNRSSGKLAAKHLIACGAKRFVYITANDSPLESDDRLAGFKSHLASQDIEDFEIFKYESDQITSSQSSHLANFLLNQSKTQRVGVFCHHDGFAATIINICNKKKIPVPDKVAVLGYDNLSLTQYTTPQISSFSYDFKEIAKSLIQSLIARIKSPQKPTSTKIFPTYLLIRNSTKTKD